MNVVGIDTKQPLERVYQKALEQRVQKPRSYHRSLVYRLTIQRLSQLFGQLAVAAPPAPLIHRLSPTEIGRLTDDKLATFPVTSATYVSLEGAILLTSNAFTSLPSLFPYLNKLNLTGCKLSYKDIASILVSLPGLKTFLYTLPKTCNLITLTEMEAFALLKHLRLVQGQRNAQLLQQLAEKIQIDESNCIKYYQSASDLKIGALQIRCEEWVRRNFSGRLEMYHSGEHIVFRIEGEVALSKAFCFALLGAKAIELQLFDKAPQLLNPFQGIAPRVTKLTVAKRDFRLVSTLLRPFTKVQALQLADCAFEPTDKLEFALTSLSVDSCKGFTGAHVVNLPNALVSLTVTNSQEWSCTDVDAVTKVQTKLKKVDFSGCKQVQNPSSRYLFSRIEALQLLNLRGTGVTDALSKVPDSLLWLDLTSTKVGDRTLDSLCLPTRKLQALGLSYTRISPDGVSKLSLLPHLVDLSLSGIKVSSLALMRFSVTQPPLRYLHLQDSSQVTEKGLLHLVKNCPKLESIDVDSNTALHPQLPSILSSFNPNTINLSLNLQVPMSATCADIIFKRYLQIKGLILQHCNSLQSLKTLFGAMDLSRRLALEVLFLDEFSVDQSEAIGLIHTFLPDLQRLYFSGPVSNLGLAKLQELYPRVKIVALKQAKSSLPFDESALIALSYACTELEELRLSDVATLTPLGLEALVEGHQHLQKMIIRDCALITQECVDKLVKAKSLTIDFRSAKAV